jgi:hypothetical protein
MTRLETRGYLKPGWHVDYLGAHCDVTELGRRVATAVGFIVNVAPSGGRMGSADFVLRLLLNRRLRLAG